MARETPGFAQNVRQRPVDRYAVLAWRSGAL